MKKEYKKITLRVPPGKKNHIVGGLFALSQEDFQSDCGSLLPRIEQALLFSEYDSATQMITEYLEVLDEHRRSIKEIRSLTRASLKLKTKKSAKKTKKRDTKKTSNTKVATSGKKKKKRDKTVTTKKKAEK